MKPINTTLTVINCTDPVNKLSRTSSIMHQIQQSHSKYFSRHLANFYGIMYSVLDLSLVYTILENQSPFKVWKLAKHTCIYLNNLMYMYNVLCRYLIE